jgi:hypothetical protein
LTVASVLPRRFGFLVAEVLLLTLGVGDGDGEGDENDAEIVHLIGVPPLAVPEHPEEYLVL